MPHFNGRIWDKWITQAQTDVILTEMRGDWPAFHATQRRLEEVLQAAEQASRGKA